MYIIGTDKYDLNSEILLRLDIIMLLVAKGRFYGTDGNLIL